LYGSKILSKNSAKLCFVCQKKLRYLKSKICNKIPSFTISFLFFQHFLHFVFYSTYPNLSKHYGIFLCCFIGRIRDFTNDFWKILKVLLKKLLICEFFFSKFCGLQFVFLFFYYIWLFNFQFRLYVLAKKFYKFFGFFILWIRVFLKESWKIMEYFSKKYRY